MVIYDNYIENEATYVFLKGDNKMAVPKSYVIFVDDESGLIAVKGLASRKTLFLCRKASN